MFSMKIDKLKISAKESTYQRNMGVVTACGNVWIKYINIKQSSEQGMHYI
jgi:hypothetical protein